MLEVTMWNISHSQNEQEYPRYTNIEQAYVCNVNCILDWLVWMKMIGFVKIMLIIQMSRHFCKDEQLHPHRNSLVEFLYTKLLLQMQKGRIICWCQSIHREHWNIFQKFLYYRYENNSKQKQRQTECAEIKTSIWWHYGTSRPPSEVE